MDDDFNTGEAVYTILELTESVSEVTALSRDEGKRLLEFYRDASQVLGVFSSALTT